MLLFGFWKEVKRKKRRGEGADRVVIVSLILMIGCLFFDDGLGFGLSFLFLFFFGFVLFRIVSRRNFNNTINKQIEIFLLFP